MGWRVSLYRRDAKARAHTYDLAQSVNPADFVS